MAIKHDYEMQVKKAKGIVLTVMCEILEHFPLVKNRAKAHLLTALAWNFRLQCMLLVVHLDPFGSFIRPVHLSPASKGHLFPKRKALKIVLWRLVSGCWSCFVHTCTAFKMLMSLDFLLAHGSS